jgi:hypothetical protein
MAAFKQVDLVRIAKRNPGRCEFVPGTLKDWVYRPYGIECVFTGTLKCPEGTFQLVIPLVGSEAKSGSESTGREWAIIIPQQGLIDADKLTVTPYGWKVYQLERQGYEFGRAFIDRVGAGPVMIPLVYQTMISETNDPVWEKILETTPARCAVGGGPSWTMLIPGKYSEYVKTGLLKLEDGKEPTGEQKAKFQEVWNTLGIFTPGRRLPGNEKLDAHALVTLTDTAIEVRVPCEIPIPGKPGAARGRVVVVCNQPEVIAELNKLRDSANPDQGVAEPPNQPVKWRVARIESDMQEVESTVYGRQGTGGGPPGGGPPGGPPGS